MPAKASMGVSYEEIVASLKRKRDEDQANYGREAGIGSVDSARPPQSVYKGPPIVNEYLNWSRRRERRAPGEREHTTVMARLPTEALNDILENGVDNATHENVVDIAKALDSTRSAPIVVPSALEEYFTVEVASVYFDEPFRRSFLVGRKSSMCDLARAVEQASGITVEEQGLRVGYVNRKEKPERKMYRPIIEWDALALLGVLGLTEGEYIEVVRLGDLSKVSD